MLPCAYGKITSYRVPERQDTKTIFLKNPDPPKCLGSFIIIIEINSNYGTVMVPSGVTTFIVCNFNLSLFAQSWPPKTIRNLDI